MEVKRINTVYWNTPVYESARPVVTVLDMVPSKGVELMMMHPYMPTESPRMEKSHPYRDRRFNARVTNTNDHSKRKT